MTVSAATRSRALLRLAPLLLVVLLAGCGGGAGDEGLSASYVPLRLDKDEPERLLRYYFGAYAAPEGADPFDTGLLLDRSGRYYVNLDTLEARFPGAASALVDGDRSEAFEWGELEAFVDRTFNAARRLPPTLDALRAEAPYDDTSGRWFVTEVDGVMSTARRKLFVPVEALRAALRGYPEAEQRLLYPVGTTIVGEHVLDGARTETTVMRKRADGFWDFFVYDAGGALTDTMRTAQRPLKTPVQCVGCHFGTRLFEPEKSFPSDAPPGPSGPRAVHVDDVLRDAAVTQHFDEHRRRSDTILGLYNTLFVARLLSERRSGRLAPEDAELLQAVGL